MPCPTLSVASPRSRQEFPKSTFVIARSIDLRHVKATRNNSTKCDRNVVDGRAKQTVLSPRKTLKMSDPHEWLPCVQELLSNIPLVLFATSKCSPYLSIFVVQDALWVIKLSRRRQRAKKFVTPMSRLVCTRECRSRLVWQNDRNPCFDFSKAAEEARQEGKGQPNSYSVSQSIFVNAKIIASSTWPMLCLLHVNSTCCAPLKLVKFDASTAQKRLWNFTYLHAKRRRRWMMMMFSENGFTMFRSGRSECRWKFSISLRNVLRWGEFRISCGCENCSEGEGRGVRIEINDWMRMASNRYQNVAQGFLGWGASGVIESASRIEAKIRSR